ARDAPAEDGDHRRDQQPRRARRGLRPGRCGAPVADGLAGVRRLRDQDARERRRGMERLLPAGEGGPERAAAREEVSAPAFIDFQNVWLAYNDELLREGQFAVEAIDLQVGQGEVIAIVGPSGCGKSTFMKL